MKKLLIIGTGYVGLVTGTCFAEAGNHVTCLDIDQEKIQQLRNGHIPFFEPGLQELVEKNIKEKRLFFTDEYADALKDIEICFIAVATPSKQDGSCDLSFVYAAARKIAEQMEGHLIIVNKSTVPIGTHAAVSELIKQYAPSKSFDVVSNPEFLQEGSAIKNCMKPDRIIIGTLSAKATLIMSHLYQPFVDEPQQIMVMDPPSAELAKYAANAMLATRISFMNELACICEATGANVDAIRRAIGSDKRIGNQYLYPGLGYGGSCLPKDLSALKATAKAAGYDPLLLNAVEKINERQQGILNHKIQKYFASKGGVKDKTIALWGLSFKPDTDDLREAPSLFLIKQLLEQGAKLRLYDPVCMKKAGQLLQQKVLFCNDEYEAAHGADAIALVTEWKQFHALDLCKVRSLMNGTAFFDGRNQFQAGQMHQNGFEYFGIGITTC